LKVVVTGGAGFIGSHIVDALVAAGARVVCIDSLDPGVHHGAPDYLNRQADYCFADLRHWRPDDRFDDTEAVVHLAALGGVARAAREPANIIEANAGGSARLLDASLGWRKLRKFIVAGSFSVYGSNYRYRCRSCGGEQDGTRRSSDMDQGRFEVLCGVCGSECAVLPIREDASPGPLETYGASKYMQELVLRGFAHCEIAVMRFSSVYGTRLRVDDGEATIIAKLAGWIRSGTTPKLFEDGRQLRDWVYVGDIVDCATALLERPAPYPVMNVCSGIGTSLLEACAVLGPVIGVPCAPQVVGGYRPGDMRHCLGDTTRMREMLGRDPVPFAEGARLAFGGLR
jgi:dTDP-L-rhamnose 4-epimerase